MLEDGKKFIFPKDPFRSEYFLDVLPGAVGKNIKKQYAEPEKHLKQAEAEPEEDRTVKDVLKDAGKQIVASLVILVIGFFALNWSAYYQIAKTKWDSMTGVAQTQNDIQKLVAESENAQSMNSALETSGDIEVQKRQIPALNLEVAPIDNRLIIPRINQNIPIVGVSSKNLISHDWNALEKEMQEALKEGVIHYPGTSIPGQHGNIVITGHSSYFPWDPGRFKDVFALLHQMKIGDEVTIYYNQEKHVYKVTEKKIVTPDNIDVLKQTPKDKLTLITCTPVGTNLKRLIIVAEPVKESENK
ncbi:MAG: class D sortase [Candidatus Gracilibacteria bacterium]|jgi:sortase A